MLRLQIVLLLAALGTVTIGQTRIVDPIAGPYTSLRAALTGLPPNVTTSILVRGRVSAGVAVVHDNAREQWTTQGALIVPDRVHITWDQANSDMIAGVRVPPTFSGVGVGATPCLTLDGAKPLRRTNTSVEGIHIVAFATGISANPGLTGTGGFHSSTIRSLVFNQCTTGISISVSQGPLSVDHLIENCTFRNATQPQGIGGGRPALILASAHVSLTATGGGTMLGEILGCHMSSNAVGAPPVAPTAPETSGIFLAVSGNTSGLYTRIATTTILGGSAPNTATPRGLDHGILAIASDQCEGDFIVEDSSVSNCGYNGIAIYADGQASIPQVFEPGFKFPDEDEYLHPVIRRCHSFNNGNVWATIPTLNQVRQELGHGILLFAWRYGLLDARVQDCKTGLATGGLASFPNSALSRNNQSGVFILSNYLGPFGGFPVFTHAMFLTRNDSWVEGCEAFLNGIDGVTCYLRNGSGNPGIKGNRLFNNNLAGVSVEVAASLTQMQPDRLHATPVVWNNFLYSVAGTTIQQNWGVWALYSPSPAGTSIIAPVGIVGNTASRNFNAGILVRHFQNFGGIVGNITELTQSSSLDLDAIVSGTAVIEYNRAGNAASYGASNFSANALTVNPSQSNLHLAMNSPCIDRVPGAVYGPLLPNFNDDFDLQVRPFDVPNVGTQVYDVGADEFRPSTP